ncbi:MAG: hypothetical protein IJW97_09780, partial [Clostridia bacterium]|nr:hypothetical protein [Clostridia bacterium]
DAAGYLGAAAPKAIFSVPFCSTTKRNIKFFPKENMFAVFSLLSNFFANKERANKPLYRATCYVHSLRRQRTNQENDLGEFP